MVSRALVIAALLSAACGGPTRRPASGGELARAPTPWETIAREQLLADVRWLTAEDRAGRGFYQPGGVATAAWIEGVFRDHGLEVLRQPIRDGADNVIGILAGDDEAIVVAAHYDHVGIDDDGVIYPGADDNASGVAVMLAMMRAVAASRGGHTIVFIAFGAEEDGLRGSNVYVHDPLWPLDRTLAVINFDMVGRNLFEWIGPGLANAVGVVGLESVAYHREVTERAARAERLDLVAGSAELVARFGFDGRTDDWWFRQKGVPTIHFSTGLHRDYHQPTDTPERLRPEQMYRIARLATRLLVELAGRAYDSE